MDIDTRIREILLRNFPVNDNSSSSENSSGVETDTQAFFRQPLYNSGINIVGDKNVVIGSNLFYMLMFLLSYAIFLTLR